MMQDSNNVMFSMHFSTAVDDNVAENIFAMFLLPILLDNSPRPFDTNFSVLDYAKMTTMSSPYVNLLYSR